MKRVITLLMAAIMVIGTAGLASAVEFKTSGHMHILFGLQDNGPQYDKDGNLLGGFDKDYAEDNFYAGQRFRPKLTMKAEGVTAVFEAQQHQEYWGKGWTTSNGETKVKVRNAYIDWKVPGTPVSLKMGFQDLALPSIWGSPIFQTRVGAVVASVPVTDQISLAAFWARPSDNQVGGVSHNSTDMFGLIVPMDFGMAKVAPYFVYARVGDANNATGSTVYTASWNDNLMVGGVNIALAPMDALSVKLDAIVTNHSYEGPGSSKGNEKGLGWLVAAAIDYEMPFGTPGFFAWYSPGADKDGDGQLTTVAPAGAAPTSLGYEAYATWGHGDWVGSSLANSMGVGLQVADMSFIDSLKHTIRVAYIMGTADKDLAGGAKRAGKEDFWTEKDSFIEVNFDSNWSIYENLSAAVDMGLLLPDFGSNTKAASGTAGYQDDMAWRTQVTFKFTF